MPELGLSPLDRILSQEAPISPDEGAIVVVRWIEAANKLAGLPPEGRAPFSWRVIVSSEPAVGYLMRGEVGQARDFLIRVYRAFHQILLAEIPHSTYDDALDRAFHAAYGPPMAEVIQEVRRGWELSYGDLARLFGVSDETARRWAQGLSEPSPRALPVLRELHDASRRLARFFRPERIAEVLRRPAELFDGETALEWILRARIRDVADRYDMLLSYQR